MYLPKDEAKQKVFILCGHLDSQLMHLSTLLQMLSELSMTIIGMHSLRGCMLRDVH